MEEPLIKSAVEENKNRPICTENLQHDLNALSGPMSRKEKRKAMKKLKRKQLRKEIAVKERVEEEARLKDPEEQRRIQLMEQEEAERIERERKDFEEKEKAWIEAMEMKKKEAAEEEERKALEESHNRQHKEGSEFNEEDDEWEYVEEGPPEIIWKGNEIIFKKKKVRIPKRAAGHQNKREDADRPTSNPLPPESEVFADNTSLSMVSAQQVLGNVAQQVPNFGTEQDKAHCPFHLKTGACRFGQRCSRVHFYPDRSCTLLVKNMYNGPGLAWEQDEGLEYTDEEVERCFEEFYEDVHTEFLKFGEIVNFKVCKNGSFHLRGNVYIQYKSLDSALLAYNSINGRYFAGKQVRCEFVNLTRWKVAICGEYMKSGFKTCSHGTACNFIHCFRNPGRDYEWADSDKPPPKYWVRRMAALFGNSGDYQKVMERENSRALRNYSKTPETDSERYRSRRSTSREMDRLYHGGSGRRRHEDERMRTSIPDEETSEQDTILKDKQKRKGKICDDDSCKEWLNEVDRENHHKRARRSSIYRNKDGKIRTYEVDSDDDREKQHGRVGRSSGRSKWDGGDWTSEAESDGDELGRHRGRKKKRHHSRRKGPRNQNGDGSNVTSEADPGGDWSGKDRDRERERNHNERENSRHHNRDSSNVTSEAESCWDLSDGDKDRKTRRHHRKRKRSRHRNRDYGSEAESDGDRADRDTVRKMERHFHKRSSRHQKRDSRNGASEAKYDEGSFEKDGDTKSRHGPHGSSRKSLRHCKSGFEDDYGSYDEKSDKFDGD